MLRNQVDIQLFKPKMMLYDSYDSVLENGCNVWVARCSLHFCMQIVLQNILEESLWVQEDISSNTVCQQFCSIESLFACVLENAFSTLVFLHRFQNFVPVFKPRRI